MRLASIAKAIAIALNARTHALGSDQGQKADYLLSLAKRAGLGTRDSQEFVFLRIATGSLIPPAATREEGIDPQDRKSSTE